MRAAGNAAAKRRSVAPVHRLHGAARVARGGERRLGVRQQRLPGLHGTEHAGCRRAVEEGAAEVGLQLLQTAAERPLRAPERSRRAEDAAFPQHRDEGGDLVQRHLMQNPDQERQNYAMGASSAPAEPSLRGGGDCDMPATLEQIARFAARHAEPGVIVLPNAWDPGSVALMAEAGFEAIATTGAGIAHPRGLPDGALGRDEMLEHAARIARAVPVPVTADLEDGYSARAEDVGLTVAAAVEAGLSGGNIEDSGMGGDPALIDTERACDWLRAAAHDNVHGGGGITGARRGVGLRWPSDPAARVEWRRSQP